jgi:hypothetical protein
MKRLLALALLLLVVAPAAQAKGPTRICGASGCVDLASEADTFNGVMRMSLAEAAATLAAVRPAPYFRISGITGATVWVPSANALRFAYSWAAPTDGELTLLREKTAGMTPFQPPRHALVYVDWEVVKNGDGYIKLATIGAPVAAAPAKTRWVDVHVMGGNSPWNDGSVRLSVARNGYLLRDDRVYRIPVVLAKRVIARLAI